MKYVLTGCVGALIGYLLWPPQSATPTIPPPLVVERASPSPDATAAKALELPDESMRVEQLVECLSQWVAQDGKAALAWAATHIHSHQQSAILHDVLATWAWHDPEALIAWFREGYLPNEFRHAHVHVRGPRNESIGRLITHWLALRDPVRAARFVVDDIYQFKTNIALSGIGETLAEKLVTSQEHQQVCQALLPYHERNQRHLSGFHQILQSWQEVDPEAANAFLKRYPEPGPTPDDLAAQRVYSSSPQSKPSVADQRVADAPPEERTTVMQTIISAWAMQDADAASLWLSNQGSAPETLPAHATLAERIAEDDPHAGIEHAAILPEGTLLESTLESIISEWATQSIDEATAFIKANPLDWSSERRDRLYQLALTVPKYRGS